MAGGAFKPGPDPRRNMGGRPKGKTNKNTETLRNKVRKFVDDNLWTIQADFDQMPSKERLLFVEKLLRHVLPPPLHELEKLTEEQLKEVINSLRNGHEPTAERTKIYSHD